MKIRVKDEDGEVREINVSANKMLLEQLEEAGYDIPNACKIWTCWACMCTVTSWADGIDKAWIREPMFPLDDVEVLTCTATIKEGAEDVEIELE